MNNNCLLYYRVYAIIYILYLMEYSYSKIYLLTYINNNTPYMVVLYRIYVNIYNRMIIYDK